MIGRLAASAGALLIGALSIGSGLYQTHSQAPVDASRPRYVHKGRAQQALVTGDFATAIQQGRMAISDRPFDQAAISTLGAAYLAAKDRNRAFATFTLAGALGWRDPVTQRYWIDQSLGAGAVTAASQWLDAAMRTGDAGEVGEAAQNAFAALESTNEGQAALLARIRKRPLWIDNWVRGSPLLSDTALDERAVVIDAARRSGISPGRDAVAAAAASLFSNQRYRLSLELWQAAETPGAMVRSGLWDDDFSRWSDTAFNGPFEWRLAEAGAIQPTIELGDTGKQLLVSSDSTTVQFVARQSTILPIGPMKISWQSTTAGDDSSVLRPTVNCIGHSALSPVADGHDGQTQWEVVVIPAQGCPIQNVSLWFDPGLSGLHEASLRYVRFQPVDMK